MSILGSIVTKILGHHSPAPATPSAAPSAPAPGAPQASTPGPAAPQPSSVGPAPSTAPSTAQVAPTGGGAASTAPVDVAALLDGLASKSAQTLDWKHSIVDMMKLLDLDSSLAARQALAKELDYTGDMHDSATMNLWLHKQVMSKLAENGGKVPDDLRH